MEGDAMWLTSVCRLISSSLKWNEKKRLAVCDVSLFPSLPLFTQTHWTNGVHGRGVLQVEKHCYQVWEIPSKGLYTFVGVKRNVWKQLWVILPGLAFGLSKSFLGGPFSMMGISTYRFMLCSIVCRSLDFAYTWSIHTRSVTKLFLSHKHSHISHTHTQLIITYLQILGLEKNAILGQKAWWVSSLDTKDMYNTFDRCWFPRNFMNDSLRTNVFVRYSPETIACACISLAARQLQVLTTLEWSLCFCKNWWWFCMVCRFLYPRNQRGGFCLMQSIKTFRWQECGSSLYF